MFLSLLVVPVAQGYATDEAAYSRVLNKEAQVSAQKGASLAGANSEGIKKRFDANRFDVIKGELPADLSYREFEDILRNNFMGSYIFFKRLDKDARVQVYQHYIETPSMSALRQRVIQLSRSKPKGLPLIN